MKQLFEMKFFDEQLVVDVRTDSSIVGTDFVFATTVDSKRIEFRSHSILDLLNEYTNVEDDEKHATIYLHGEDDDAFHDSYGFNSEHKERYFIIKKAYNKYLEYINKKNYRSHLPKWF